LGWWRRGSWQGGRGWCGESETGGPEAYAFVAALRRVRIGGVRGRVERALARAVFRLLGARPFFCLCFSQVRILSSQLLATVCGSSSGTRRIFDGVSSTPNLVLKLVKDEMATRTAASEVRGHPVDS
jgi:hypothetical protein